MFSIGQMSKRTGVKVPTIRYYEQVGLLCEPARSAGNQRRYEPDQLQRLGFIKHARELGFPVQAILSLIKLNDHPDQSCAQANEIAQHQRLEVRKKIAALTRLEAELARIVEGCASAGTVDHCYVMASLADHSKCEADHSV